jgi:hypothetical protein
LFCVTGLFATGIFIYSLPIYRTLLYQDCPTSIESLKQVCKSQKTLIGYREYVQLCLDFKLRSTSLLTAIQVGEIYLSTTPLSPHSREVSGMSFENFTHALLLMAFLAYREAERSASPACKTSALLLHMWKTVNDNSSKSKERANQARAVTLTSFAGSMNLFGAASFSDSFLMQWHRDGFR